MPYRAGQIILIALVFFSIVTGVTAAAASALTASERAARSAISSEEALRLAEAGIDEAAYSLNQDSSYAGETNTALGDGAFSVTVSTVDDSTKEITSTGYVPSAADPVAEKTVHAEVSINSNVVSFRYGVEAGAGGFVLSGGATINGSAYANGSINATTGVHITGSAYAADPPASYADQANDTPTPISSCTSATCISFGNASATQDLAQSFTISSSEALNTVQLYIEKVGTPSDATVRIVTDNGGSPSTNTLMTGTLSAAQVTNSFGWVSVTMPSTPVLAAGQTYWLVVDNGSNSTSKYYVVGANASYANGSAMLGKFKSTWAATSPSGLDAYFRVYLGGGTSMIGGDTYTTGVYIGGDANAHTVEGATVTGSLYCQSASYTNKTCDTSQADPSPGALPVSDGNIAEWKNEASAGTTISGDESVGSAGAMIGPAHITGNLTVGGGGTLTVAGTLWVDGSVTVSGGGKVQLASSYGASDGVIVADGPVSIGGGATFAGSGTAGSYPFVVTTSSCPAAAGCSGADAITLSGGAGAVALIAQNGTADIEGGSALKQVTANEIVMSGGASLTYDSGLIDANFTSGPGGSWAFVPGTYGLSP